MWTRWVAPGVLTLEERVQLFRLKRPIKRWG